MAKVLISDKLDPLAVEIFESKGIEVDFKPGLSPEEQIAIIGNYDGLAIRSATTVTAEMIDAAKNLKVVGRAGIGVDNVDVEAATEEQAAREAAAVPCVIRHWPEPEYHICPNNPSNAARRRRAGSPSPGAGWRNRFPWPMR